MWTRSFLTMFVLAVLSSCISDDSDKDSQGVNLVVGDSLPTFQVTMNDGSTIRTSDLLGGVSVVVLFSVDCGDCRMELPEVQRLWNQQLGVPIVLIARENTEEVIRSFWQQAHSRIPRIYISDAQGVIRFSHADDAMPTAEQLADEIKAINNK